LEGKSSCLVFDLPGVLCKTVHLGKVALVTLRVRAMEPKLLCQI